MQLPQTGTIHVLNKASLTLQTHNLLYWVRTDYMTSYPFANQGHDASTQPQSPKTCCLHGP